MIVEIELGKGINIDEAEVGDLVVEIEAKDRIGKSVEVEQAGAADGDGGGVADLVGGLVEHDVGIGSADSIADVQVCGNCHAARFVQRQRARIHGGQTDVGIASAQES